jgi:hypothetical protein
MRGHSGCMPRRGSSILVSRNSEPKSSGELPSDWMALARSKLYASRIFPLWTALATSRVNWNCVGPGVGLREATISAMMLEIEGLGVVVATVGVSRRDDWFASEVVDGLLAPGLSRGDRDGGGV